MASTSTSRQVVLGLLEASAVASCIWGMYSIYGYSSSSISLIYNALWFILGCISNLFGIISIVYYNFDPDDDKKKSLTLLQLHFLFAWFCVIIGYQSFVANTWMIYSGSHYALLHSLLSLLPLGMWVAHQNKYLVISTQAITAFGLFSHFFICYLAKNVFGMIGACIMICNVTALSIPTRFSFLGATSREFFIVGLGLASYIFYLSVEDMTKHPHQVKDFLLW